MMYDELVKKLRYCGNAISCLNCPYWEGCGGSKEDLTQAADAIEDLQQQLDDETEYATALVCNVPQWIPCRERLPEKDTTVIVCDSYSGYMGIWNYLDDVWEDSYGYYKQIDEVTHWMPLPEPLKEE